MTIIKVNSSAQAVLQSLCGGRRNEEEVVVQDCQRWLEEKMQEEAQKGQHEVTNMSLNFRGMGSQPRLFDALAAMLSRNSLNPADISTLYNLYSEPQPPSARYLHIPQLLGKYKCWPNLGRRTSALK